jgi:hypothetical protein
LHNFLKEHFSQFSNDQRNSAALKENFPKKSNLRIIHRKKSFSIFPSPAGMSLTKHSLGGNYDVIYKLFLLRESLVNDIPAGDGKIEKLFLRCIASFEDTY